MTRKIAVVGAGYVGLVTGVALAQLGHYVTCIDVDTTKVDQLNRGELPIYEEGLRELLLANREAGRISFTAHPKRGLRSAEVIYIAVGTPPKEDGSADLRYVESAAYDIASYATQECVVVCKSTVPVGTNEQVLQWIEKEKKEDIKVHIASNPEFLRQGSAVYDTFHPDRIVIGSNSSYAWDVLTEINAPFEAPIVKTDLASAEMIKYAANAFLAMKISFVNEIANLSEKLGANIEDVVSGIGKDQRIGEAFLRPGIGYGGSCFPKDTKALSHLGSDFMERLRLIETTVEVNDMQPSRLIQKAIKRYGDLAGKRMAVLGLSFKPGTDDMREAPSLSIVNGLVDLNAEVVAYDPVAMERAATIFEEGVDFASSVEEALTGADGVFILTEWPVIKNIAPDVYAARMNQPIIFDGRNCYGIEEMKEAKLEYYSIGRPPQFGQLISNPLT
ncbi:UDP-glucose 6-dehydrogenase [Pontibacillus halophilus JSM 076056 = DSM 19796]|uniref:UDP-glucose 6-dehydrogenase n=1 Tax=Pontibacillus halophilus JSM 076056 = DSM 19796 TaxID=1385510 RepID=A0A0A5GRY5_9BACI|nr:UDP-glucose/GDP-mannose dehydrogenase family protein [Pontibacillus halophilus]KGX93925.1 UDP-glucose 6-dehydrogenase [Pontibacillus halophilus JSM 076056 = DSM 19796]